MNIVIFKHDELESGGRLSLDGRRAEHIYSVLKAQPGDSVRLGEYAGGLHRGIILESGKERVQIELTGQVESQVSPHAVNLVLAMPRPQTLKKVIEIASCFSIQSIQVIQSAKVEQNYFSSKLLGREEIEKHVILGLEQGRKVIPPNITVHRSYFKDNKDSELCRLSSVVLEANAPSPFISSSILKEHRKQALLTIAIGPEGGWSDEELKWFTDRHFSLCSLGPTPLRVEHAVCSVLGVLEQFAYSESLEVDCPAEKRQVAEFVHG